MISMENYKLKEVEKDNTIIVNGVEFLVSDSVADTIMNIINGNTKKRPSSGETIYKDGCIADNIGWMETTDIDGKKFQMVIGRKQFYRNAKRGNKYFKQFLADNYESLGLKSFECRYQNRIFTGYGCTTKKQIESAMKKMEKATFTADDINAVELNSYGW